MDADDLPAVITIEGRAFSHPWPAEAFQDLGYIDSLVLADDGLVIGYIMYQKVLDECAIINFAIDPSHQGKGRGDFLLDSALQRITSQEIRFVYLDVRISNNAAKHLYEKAGFKRVGSRKGYYTNPDEDSLVMLKIIEDSNPHA